MEVNSELIERNFSNYVLGEIYKENFNLELKEKVFQNYLNYSTTQLPLKILSSRVSHNHLFFDEKSSKAFYFSSQNNLIEIDLQKKQQKNFNFTEQKIEEKKTLYEEPTMKILYDSNENQFLLINNGSGLLLIFDKNEKNISKFECDCSLILDSKMINDQINIIKRSCKDSGSSLSQEKDSTSKLVNTISFDLQFLIFDLKGNLQSKEEFNSETIPKICFISKETGDIIFGSNSEITHKTNENEMIVEDEPIITENITKEESKKDENFIKMMNERLAPFTTDKFEDSDEDDNDSYSESIYIFKSEIKKLEKIISNKRILTCNSDKIGIAFDVDLCVFSFKNQKFEHEFTVNAFKYIIDGRPKRKEICSFDSKGFIIEEEQISIYDTSNYTIL
eukprot:gene6673-10837_t